MKRTIIWLCIISAFVAYIKFGTADNWQGKTFPEIFFFVDPSIREEATRKAFLEHADPIYIEVMYKNGTSEKITIEPYSSMYFNQYPELRVRQIQGLFIGSADSELVCDNWDVKVDGVKIERYSPIAVGVTRFKILK
jgi:hypothetical protein